MFAVVFPGQGSQKVGMGRELCENSPSALKTFEKVEAATGLQVRHLCWESDEETLRQTAIAQIALFTCGLAAWNALAEEMPGAMPAVFAGHSVGEYAALAAAGICSVQEGARLVQLRGELMGRAGTSRSGAMAAVLGLDAEVLAKVCQAASSPDSVVVIANDNCPGQIVISGDAGAVEWAGALALEQGAKRALPLNVSGAFHSPLMESSAAEMGVRLRQTEFRKGNVPVISNVTAAPVADAGDWPDLLERQLRSSVRWRESMLSLANLGVKRLVECGTGEVLCGLMKRIAPDVPCLAVNSNESLQIAASELSGVSA